jgi:hypothetical protein
MEMLRRLGLRWQGGSRDTAFVRAALTRIPTPFRPREGGVALRFPPQSKTRSDWLEQQHYAPGSWAVGVKCWALNVFQSSNHPSIHPMILAETFASNINWSLLASAVMAVATLGLWWDARKRRSTAIEPQPLAVEIARDLHEQFAGKRDFDELKAGNTRRHAELFQKIEAVEAAARLDLARELKEVNEDRRRTLEKLNEQFTFIRENIAEIKTELKLRRDL